MSKLNKEQRMFARAALRGASYKWPPRNEALKFARVSRGLYECAKCLKHFTRGEIQLDHKEPVIPTHGKEIDLDEEAARLLVYRPGFQVLCKVCHKSKSAQENNTRRVNKSLASKK